MQIATLIQEKLEIEMDLNDKKAIKNELKKSLQALDDDFNKLILEKESIEAEKNRKLIVRNSNLSNLTEKAGIYISNLHNIHQNKQIFQNFLNELASIEALINGNQEKIVPISDNLKKMKSDLSDLLKKIANANLKLHESEKENLKEKETSKLIDNEINCEIRKKSENDKKMILKNSLAEKIEEKNQILKVLEKEKIELEVELLELRNYLSEINDSNEKKLSENQKLQDEKDKIERNQIMILESEISELKLNINKPRGRMNFQYGKEYNVHSKQEKIKIGTVMNDLIPSLKENKKNLKNVLDVKSSKKEFSLNKSNSSSFDFETSTVSQSSSTQSQRKIICFLFIISFVIFSLLIIKLVCY